MAQAKEIYKNRVKNCLWCGKQYRFFPYEEKVTKYCSRSCGAKMVMTGKKHRPESIEKMKKAKIGCTVSQITREKIRETLKIKHGKGIIKTAFIKGHKVFPLTDNGRRKISEAHSGEKNHNWSGGTVKWARQKARVRDDYTCQVCGLRDPEIIEVDHVKPIQKSNRYGFIDDLSNLQCICPNCHRRKTNRFLKKINTGKFLKTKKYV